MRGRNPGSAAGAVLLAALVSGCGGTDSDPFAIARPAGSSSAPPAGESPPPTNPPPSGPEPGDGSANPPLLSTDPFWIPFSVTANAAGGQAGLFVVPSGSPATAPAFVTTSPVEILGAGANIKVSDTQLATAHLPGTLIYAAADSTSHVHIYGLDLSNAAATPTPNQISNLSLSLTQSGALGDVICADSKSLSATANILDATSLFVVLHIAGTAGCNTTGDTWQVVHYHDSATTAPSGVSGITSNSATPTYFKPLYQDSGALSGITVLDAGSGKLQLYADDSFANPTTLIANATSVATLYDSNSLANGATSAGTTLFMAVTSSSGQSVYRLPQGASSATMEYTVQGTLGAKSVADDGNVYFTDTAAATGQASYGAITTSGSSALGSTPLGTSSGSGTSTQNVSGNTLTVNEVTTANNETGSLPGGIEKITATNTFNGTYTNGAFVATSGSFTNTDCVDVDTANPHCASVPLNTATNFDTVTTSAGGITVAGGGTITITRSTMGVNTTETYAFAANNAAGPTTTQTLLRAPLAGGTAAPIYSSSTSYDLIGANNSVVVLSSYSSSGNTSTLYTTKADASSPATSASSLGESSYHGNISSSFMQPVTVGKNDTSVVCVTSVDSASSPATYASEILSPDGTVKQPLKSGTAFINLAASRLSGSILQVQSIPGGGYDGGTLYNVRPGTLTGAGLGGTALTAPGGAAYTIPAGTAPALSGVSNTIGAGALQPVGGANAALGLVDDLSNNLVVPIGTNLTNSSITLAQ
jgi:hypothetical protein